MNGVRYRRLLRRGYAIDTIVNVRHIDDVFSSPPRIYRRSSKLIMRKGLSTRVLRFRRLNADQLETALRCMGGGVR